MTTYLTPDIGKASQSLMPLIAIEVNKDAGQRATGLAIQPYNGTTPGLKVDLLSNKGKATCPGNGN